MDHTAHPKLLPDGLLALAMERLQDMLVISEVGLDEGADARIVYVNDAFLRRTGYRRDEVIGQSSALLQGPQTDPATLYAMEAWLSQGRPARKELVRYTRTREPFWAEVDAVPYTADGGRITHWVSVERDITERRSTQRMLDERAQALQATIRHTSDAIFTTNGQGLILSINPGAERIFGTTRAAALKQPLSKFLHGEWRAGAGNTGTKAAPRARSARSRRMKGAKADGTPLDLEATVTEVQVGEQWTATVYARDVTERTRSEQALVHY